MPRKQVRGPVRDGKAGLRKGPGLSNEKTEKLLDEALKYLESELKMLLASPGCFKEVMHIAKGLEAIRASRSGGSSPPSIRSEFDLGSE